MKVAFYSSAFCEPCMLTRSVLAEASRLVPTASVVELDVARDEARAQADGIRLTPTVIIAADDGTEVFRAEGAPTLNQVLVALAKAV
ncbi:MAG: thioredoxin family protein [Rhodoglobus sp.]